MNEQNVFQLLMQEIETQTMPTNDIVKLSLNAGRVMEMIRLIEEIEAKTATETEDEPCTSKITERALTMFAAKFKDS